MTEPSHAGEPAAEAHRPAAPGGDAVPQSPPASEAPAPGGSALQTLAMWLILLAGTALVMAWLAGAFETKVDRAGSPADARPPALVPQDARTARVRRIELAVVEVAPGAIRAVHETRLASRILAEVIDVRIAAGQPVNRGDTLIRLDQRDLDTRVQQAAAALEQARVRATQARDEFDRLTRLRQQGLAAQTEFDRASTARAAAEADVQRAEQFLAEAESVRKYATITSPMTGIVIDKLVEVGDMVTPGQVLATLYDPDRMQLVASVREGVATRLRVGDSLDVHIDALDKTCTAEISEIVPQADAASRSFQVKVTGPCPPGVYSGMFGRLLIETGTRPVHVVDPLALRRVGQLVLVDVVRDGQLHRRTVRIGRELAEGVEVLSGLSEGEEVLLHTSAGDRVPATNPGRSAARPAAEVAHHG